jgi:hypothetical protein
MPSVKRKKCKKRTKTVQRKKSYNRGGNAENNRSEETDSPALVNYTGIRGDHQDLSPESMGSIDYSPESIRDSPERIRDSPEKSRGSPEKRKGLSSKTKKRMAIVMA